MVEPINMSGVSDVQKCFAEKHSLHSCEKCDAMFISVNKLNEHKNACTIEYLSDAAGEETTTKVMDKQWSQDEIKNVHISHSSFCFCGRSFAGKSQLSKHHKLEECPYFFCGCKKKIASMKTYLDHRCDQKESEKLGNDGCHKLKVIPKHRLACHRFLMFLVTVPSLDKD